MDALTLEWLSELIDMTISAQSNAFRVKRIEREAHALLNTSGGRAEICWLLLTFAAFLQGDRDRCIRCAEAAYALAKHDAMIVGNAASLLNNVGAPRLAAAYGRQLLSLSDGDARIAVNAARVLYGALCFEEAAEIVSLRDNRHGLTESDGFLAFIGGLLSTFQEHGVDVELRMALLESAISTICAEGCRIRRTTPVNYPDDTMRYEFFIEQSASQCGSIDYAIAKVLTEKFDDAHPEVVTFVCRPLTSYTPAGVSIEVER
ncbi:hypothetical protein [Caballeronia cordobensis]|uniref:hypothetical protein n=1 Tax=Caballeronia cordobensis TaxID=1353886 RepID=UPI0011870E45